MGPPSVPGEPVGGGGEGRGGRGVAADVPRLWHFGRHNSAAMKSIYTNIQQAPRRAAGRGKGEGKGKGSGCSLLFAGPVHLGFWFVDILAGLFAPTPASVTLEPLCATKNQQAFRPHDMGVWPPWGFGGGPPP